MSWTAPLERRRFLCARDLPESVFALRTLPYGIMAEIDCARSRLSILEPGVPARDG
jgi:hypothetical protein